MHLAHEVMAGSRSWNPGSCAKQQDSACKHHEPRRTGAENGCRDQPEPPSAMPPPPQNSDSAAGHYRHDAEQNDKSAPELVVVDHADIARLLVALESCPLRRAWRARGIRSHPDKAINCPDGPLSFCRGWFKIRP